MQNARLNLDRCCNGTTFTLNCCHGSTCCNSCADNSSNSEVEEMQEQAEAVERVAQGALQAEDQQAPQDRPKRCVIL